MLLESLISQIKLFFLLLILPQMHPNVTHVQKWEILFKFINKCTLSSPTSISKIALLPQRWNTLCRGENESENGAAEKNCWWPSRKFWKLLFTMWSCRWLLMEWYKSHFPSCMFCEGKKKHYFWYYSVKSYEWVSL